MSFNLEEYFAEFYDKIKELIKTRAPKLHSSETTDYGKATDTKYGHVKVENDIVDSDNPVKSSVIRENINRIDTKLVNMTVDSELSPTSQKPVENRVITNKINNLDGSSIKLNGTTNQTLEDAINSKHIGRDGKGLEFIFKLMPSLVEDWTDLPEGVINPSTLDAVQDDDFIPEGWTDDQEEVSWEIPYQYVSTRTKEIISEDKGGDGYTAIWGKFNEPKLWGVYGEKPFCHLRYADISKPTNWNDTFPQPQSDITSGGKKYHKYEGYLWNEEQVLSDANKDPLLFTWRIYRPTIGVAGKEGSFLHIQYAENEAGDGMNQYEGDYIGTCVTWDEVDPDDPDLYNWVKIKGDDAVNVEFVYYTTDEENYNSLPSNIKNQPELKRWCQRPFDISEENQYCYISIKDVNDNTWSEPVLWAKYGADGEDGAVGERGQDGIGLEMIFSRNNSTDNHPEFIDNQNLNSFDGIVANKHFTDDDFVPEGWDDDQQGVNEDYTVEWVSMRFKRIGNDGKIAVWSDFNTPKVWATYSEDGKGVESINEKYYLHTNYNNIPSNVTWSDNVPFVPEGKFLWTKTFITYTDGTTSSTKPKCVTGRDGTGVHYVYFCYDYETSPSPPEWSDIHGNTGTNNDYNRWVEDPVNVTSNNKYLFVSQSTTHAYDSNGNKYWVDFSEPKIWAIYTEDGEDGLSITLGTDNQSILVDGNGSLKQTPTVFNIPIYCYKGDSRIPATIDLSKISNVFDQKVVNNHPSATSDGLITLATRNVPNQVMNNESIDINVDGKTITKIFTWNKIGDGKDGNPGGTIDFVYYTKDENEPPTIQSNTQIDNNSLGTEVNKWCARPTDTSEEYPYCFGAYIYLDNEGNHIGDYSEVYLWAKYGIDGRSISEVINYYTTTTSSNTPDKTTYLWETDISNVQFNEINKYLWNYEEVKAGNTVINSTTPVMIAYYATDGTDGLGIYSISSTITINTWSSSAYPDGKYITSRSPIETELGKSLSVGEHIIYGNYMYKILAIGNNPNSGNYGLSDRISLKGEAGTNHEYAYYTSSSATPPSKPVGNVTETTGTEKWTTVPVAMTSEKKYMYISYRVNSGTWSNTALWSKFGEDGKSITDVVNYYGSTSKYDNAISSDHNDSIWSAPTYLTRELEHTTIADTVSRVEYTPISGNISIEFDARVKTNNMHFVSVRQDSTILVYTTPNLLNMTLNKWYHLKITITGNQATILNVDTGDTITGDATGFNRFYFRCSANGEMAFKNFKVFSDDVGWYDDITKVPFSSTNKYLWTKEVTKAGNEVVGESTPIMIAEYGKGGQSILSITEEYRLSTDTSESSMIDSWSSIPPTMTVINKYLWNREIINYSNPESSQISTPKIIGVYGDTGDDGIGVYRISTDITINDYSNSSYPDSRYRVLKTDVNTEVGKALVLGEHLMCGDYIYEIVLVGSSYYHLGEGTMMKGADGARGKDGIGLEHIFYLSDTEINWDTNDNLYNDSATTDTSSKYSKTNCTLSFNTNRLIMTRTVSEGSSYIDLRIESQEVLSKYLGKKIRFECDIVSATAGCSIRIYQLINGTYSNSGSSTFITSGHLSREWVIDKNATQVVFRLNGTNIGLNGTCSFRNFKVSSFTDPTKWDITGDFQNDDYVRPDSGWTDDATGVDVTHMYEYCSIRMKTPNSNGVGEWGAFSEPSLWAKFGEKGDTGKGISSVAEKYNLSTGTATNTMISNNWVDSPPTLTKTNKYLWNYEIITWTDGTTTETNKRIIGIYGDTGEAGADGKGLEMIFCQTATIDGYSINPSTLNANQTVDYYPSGWTDDQSGVSKKKPYEYMCLRTSDKNGTWSKFSPPKLWATYSEDGQDGISVDVQSVVNEVENNIDLSNIDASTLGTKSSSEFMEVNPLFWSKTQNTVGTGTVECRKLGMLIIINVISCTVKNFGASAGGWEKIRENNSTNLIIPADYRPSTPIIIGAGSNSGNNTKDMQLRLGIDGTIDFKRNAFLNITTDTQETLSGTFVFFKDNRIDTRVYGNATEFYTGDILNITLQYNNNGTWTKLANKIVTININGVNYSRTTDNNGIAQLNLDLNSNNASNIGYINYNVAIKFGGDEEYKSSSVNNTIKMKWGTATITETTANIVYRNTPITGVVKNQNGNPLKNIEVIYSSVNDYSGYTDSNGRFSILHPNDGISHDKGTDTTVSAFLKINNNFNCKAVQINSSRTYR